MWLYKNRHDSAWENEGKGELEAVGLVTQQLPQLQGLAYVIGCSKVVRIHYRKSPFQNKEWKVDGFCFTTLPGHPTPKGVFWSQRLCNPLIRSKLVGMDIIIGYVLTVLILQGVLYIVLATVSWGLLESSSFASNLMAWIQVHVILCCTNILCI